MWYIIGERIVIIMANANREGTKISWHLLFCLAFSVVTGLACILVQYVVVVGKVSLPLHFSDNFP